MILQGDCIERLRELPDQSVHCCVTSPPYWGLRDYGADGQIGLEGTPEAYVSKMVEVFREVRRVLRDDGTLWLNLGDSYSGTGKSGGGKQGEQWTVAGAPASQGKGTWQPPPFGLKPKDLVGIPWMVAFALRADGWYLRQDIIWHKPNPMPESVRDRCTKAHEYIFLLSKSERYYYDHEAIMEPMALSSVSRLSQDIENQEGSIRANGGAKTNGTMKAVGRHLPGNKTHKGTSAYENGDEKHRTKAGLVEYAKRVRANSFARNVAESPKPGSPAQHRPDRPDVEYTDVRNKRSVWTIATQPFKEAHFATFPPKLIEPCILAGCPPGGAVLDPFFGSGTTGLVAVENGREFIGIELNPEYIEIAIRRLDAVQPKIQFN